MHTHLLDLEICRNFQRRGWLPLLEVEHPPPATMIREFYLNLSVHSDDSNIQFVKCWIRGENVVVVVLGVPLV